MTDVLDDTAADQALKTKHRAIWASGDYAAVAEEVVAGLGPVVAAASGCGAGDRVLDIAAGAGNASVPAARAGAAVVATDLTPELLQAGERRPDVAGLPITWQVADAEALPFPDAAFDVVTSCVGIMFAPHHQAAADEALRVLRPGGRFALLAWTPAGFIGQMFATMKPYAPPPPPGASPPPLWGREDHVRDLLGDRVEGLTCRTDRLRVDRFARPEEFTSFFRTNYGPTLTTFATLAPERAAELDAALTELARSFDRGTEATVMDWEYLLVTGVRR